MKCNSLEFNLVIAYFYKNKLIRNRACSVKVPLWGLTLGTQDFLCIVRFSTSESTSWEHYAARMCILVCRLGKNQWNGCLALLRNDTLAFRAEIKNLTS